MRDSINAAIVLRTTRLQKGCWDPIAKSALDRSIGLLSPFFQQIDGETHHQPRYRTYPNWAVLAVTDDTTTDAERDRFRLLVARNALNMHAKAHWVGFVDEHASADDVRRVLQQGIDHLRRASASAIPKVTRYIHRGEAHGIRSNHRPRRALLWIGSAKPSGTSTSEALGTFMLEQLEARGWTRDTIHVARSVRLLRDGIDRLVEAIHRADLIIIASPVYVDCLPALVLRGLEQLREATFDAHPRAMLPIVQGGFPEVEHTAIALEILADHAQHLGWHWAGHLAMGGGGMVQPEALSKGAGRLYHQLIALDTAINALDAGLPVPPEATEEFAKLAVSKRLYRTFGQLDWVRRAISKRAFLNLWDHPFDQADTP